MSVVAAKGFSAAGVAAGIKPSGVDLALVVSEVPAAAAGVFTTNQAAAAPVLLCRRHLANASMASAVVINSGCANAATGGQGTKNARRMAEAVAERLGADESDVLVCSTGTIGPQLPMEGVLAGIAAAVTQRSGEAVSGTAAARAMMTTDSVEKEAVVHRDGWSIGGMAKGAGMIRPDMATMLAVLTTDARVPADVLQRALERAVDGSFNSLNIDGCESTNDSVVLLANGASGEHPDEESFTTALTSVCTTLALAMAADAEGASRVVTIEVTGASDDTIARSLGRLVADSALVRASFYGGDVNWGRIVGALGTADVLIDFDAVEIAYFGETVFAEGVGAAYDEPALLARCEEGDLSLSIRVGEGDGTATIVTTDLTPAYVVFNGERS